MARRIYLDHNATTPLDPRVLEAMLPFLGTECGNPASRQHAFGWSARAAVEEARERCAAAFRVGSDEIVFTSGATESINIALFGLARARPSVGRHIVSTRSEHRAVLDVLDALAFEGFEVTLLPVDDAARLDPIFLEKALRPDTVLVSVIFANNEVGSINPIGRVGSICRDRGVPLHVDATQVAGRIDIDMPALGIDLLSASAHKFHGPKGVGFLAARGLGRGLRLEPLMRGGGHERGLRPGTLNVPGIVGLAEALRIGLEEREEECRRVAALRDRLHDELVERLPGLRLNGHPVERLPGNLNLSFAGIDAESLLAGLTDVAASTGSACSSAALKPSHVLEAMGLPRERIRSSVRFGLGRGTTADEIDYAVQRIVEETRRLRRISPAWEALQGDFAKP